MTASDDKLEVEGVVNQECGNGRFKVAVTGWDSEVLCTLAGKIKFNNIKIITGDTVKIEVSAYDLGKGRITFRKKA